MEARLLTSYDAPVNKTRKRNGKMGRQMKRTPTFGGAMIAPGWRPRSGTREGGLAAASALFNCCFR